MNPAKVEKMDEECLKWRKKDAVAIKRAMANPGVNVACILLIDTKYIRRNNGTIIYVCNTCVPFITKQETKVFLLVKNKLMISI